MIPAGDSGAPSTAAFPDPPKGSPGEIGAIARSFHDAAGQLDQCEHGLKGASGGLAGDWQGYAANAYQAASNGLSGVARAAAETFRECGGALSGYSQALEHAQSEIHRLRRLYDDAQTRQVNAATAASHLSTKLAAATKPADVHQLQGELTHASNQATGAGDEASGYAGRAVQVLNDFHREEAKYSQTLAGGRVGPGKHIPAGSPFAGPYTGATGIPGLGFGVPMFPGGFGVSPGGLDPYNGVIPVGDPWNSDIPGYGVYMDSITPEAVPDDDLTNAVMVVSAFTGVGAVEDVLAAGGRAAAARMGIGAVGRETAEKAGQDAFDQVISRGSYKTGDPLNTAKLREAYGAKRAAQIETEVEQDATRAETADAFLDQLDRSDLLPPGVKEAVSHAMAYGGVYRTYLERLYYALRAAMKP
jgi:uncharacterized protein YukE